MMFSTDPQHENRKKEGRYNGEKCISSGSVK